MRGTVTTRRRTLLVLDRDPAIYKYLARHLSPEGYHVSSAEPNSPLQHREELHPDVILLDLTLAQADKTLIGTMKAAWNAPVLGLLPFMDRSGISAALDAGADACIGKPFGLGEVGAQIRKLLRRDVLRRGGIPSVACDELRIDLVFRQVCRGGIPTRLTARQFRLLELLIGANGGVLTYGDLACGMFGSGSGSNRQKLRDAVQRLRSKIEPDPRQPRHIVTVPRIGYRFRMYHPDLAFGSVLQASDAKA